MNNEINQNTITLQYSTTEYKKYNNKSASIYEICNPNHCSCKVDFNINWNTFTF